MDETLDAPTEKPKCSRFSSFQTHQALNTEVKKATNRILKAVLGVKAFAVGENSHTIQDGVHDNVDFRRVLWLHSKSDCEIALNH